MRPHPTPKIRDEGLRGASKMMDDNLFVFGKIVETVRPLLHHAPTLGEVLHNLGNFLRTLATPEPIRDWSLTSLKEKLIKIGAKVVRHGRYVAFQMAEVCDHQESVRRHPAVHRGTATAARCGARVKRSIVMRSSPTHGRDAS
jgi:hypothetical protein